MVSSSDEMVRWSFTAKSLILAAAAATFVIAMVRSSTLATLYARSRLLSPFS